MGWIFYYMFRCMINMGSFCHHWTKPIKSLPLTHSKNNKEHFQKQRVFGIFCKPASQKEVFLAPKEQTIKCFVINKEINSEASLWGIRASVSFGIHYISNVLGSIVKVILLNQSGCKWYFSIIFNIITVVLHKPMKSPSSKYFLADLIYFLSIILFLLGSLVSLYIICCVKNMIGSIYSLHKSIDIFLGIPTLLVYLLIQIAMQHCTSNDIQVSRMSRN